MSNQLSWPADESGTPPGIDWLAVAALVISIAALIAAFVLDLRWGVFSLVAMGLAFGAARRIGGHITRGRWIANAAFLIGGLGVLASVMSFIGMLGNIRA
jgi:hypothetical protein